MYAIVTTGGKQYRVETGDELVVERLAADEGASVSLRPLMVRGDDVKLGDALGSASVSATVVEHLRGPKIRIVKHKPKSGYRRVQGHRQPQTRIRIEAIDA